ncbi:hypothetical protein BDN67DRAFT_973666 [Paxillus ammoniavirescens]|nr:hypothetical protein BDN67DRAFT_973666 [Paxillus ammoniavirescens]
MVMGRTHVQCTALTVLEYSRARIMITPHSIALLSCNGVRYEQAPTQPISVIGRLYSHHVYLSEDCPWRYFRDPVQRPTHIP